MLFRQEEDNIDFNKLVLSGNPHFRRELLQQTGIRDQGNQTYKFYMILLNQLKGLDPRYELYLLLTAIEDPFVNNLDIRREDLDILHLSSSIQIAAKIKDTLMSIALAQR